MFGVGSLGLLGAQQSGGGGAPISGALYNYLESAAAPPAGSIHHTSGANSLKINVIDAGGVNHTSAIQSLRAGDQITIGTQSAYLTGTPGITTGVALVLVDSWPNYTNGQYTVTINRGVLPYTTVAPVIAGASLIGSTLTCTPGTWSGSPPSPTVTRQWHANLLSIPGATGLTYVTLSGDAGKSIHCIETGTNLTGVGLSESNAIIAASLPVNTVAPVISGGPNVGSLLTTTNGTWTGLPAPTFTYHWFADLVATPGIEQTYTIRSIDVGKQLLCVVTATNPAGAANATSNGITAIQPPVNLTTPVVTGEGTPGQTLTCGTGAWNADPAATYAKQWRADGVNISGQTGNIYVVQAGDVSKTITCAVTATNTGGSATAISNGILVTAAVGNPPVNTSAPAISGTGNVGSILSLTSQGTWTGTPPITYTYQWQRNGANTGNTGNSYVVQAGDAGVTITCRVTATNVDGASNASSNGIAVAADPDAVIKALFANNEQGAWYDSSDFSTMFQDSAGTTPVNAVGQPVGLILDKSKGLALGAEQITNSADRDFSSNTGFWSLGPSATISGGVVNVNATAFDYPIYRFNFPLIVGYFEFTYTLTVVSGSIKAQIATPNGGEGPARSVSGTYTDRFYTPTPNATTGFVTAAFVGTIDNVSIRLIEGNHALQATAAARPVLRQDANSKYYLEFDGVDDRIASSDVAFSGDYMGVFKGVYSSNTTGAGFDSSVGESGAQGRYDSYFNASGIHTLELSAGAFNQTSITVGQSTKAVVSCLMDVQGATAADRIKGRLNGTIPTQTATGLPTTNQFGSNPIAMGGLDGGNKFAGRIYSLIIRGAASTTQEITDTETWVNSKTGAY